jgi:hypothetical protein
MSIKCALRADLDGEDRKTLRRPKACDRPSAIVITNNAADHDRCNR